MGLSAIWNIKDIESQGDPSHYGGQDITEGKGEEEYIEPSNALAPKKFPGPWGHKDEKNNK